jgi:hypothetical protein
MIARIRNVACGLVLAAGLAAQQQRWVPADTDGGPGVAVAASPLAPCLLALPNATVAAIVAWEFDGTAFHRRPETVPPGLGVDAAVYDAARSRIVAWCNGSSGSVVGVFDGARWQTGTTNLPSGRSEVSLGYDATRGVVVLFGGAVPGFPNGNAIDDTWELHGDTWTQVLAVNRPPARRGATFAFDPATQRMLLFGGVNAQSQASADTWSYDGATWTQLPVSGPAARYRGAMELDGQRQALVLYGGSASLLNGPQLNDAYEWNGSGWLPVAAPPAALSSPALLREGANLLLAGHDDVAQRFLVWRRSGTAWVQAFVHPETGDVLNPAFAFDGARGELLRFGGRVANPAVYLNETWTRNGSWQLRNPAQAPPPRWNAALAFDPIRAECVLFGGSTNTSSFADTWVWNGATWTQRMPALSPPAGGGNAMTFDASRGTVVLSGGLGSASHETWEWNGSTWSQVTPPLVTGAAAIQRLAFDAARGVLALYLDGYNVQPTSLWELQNGTWTQVGAGLPAGGRLVFDPQRGRLALFCPTNRFDWVNGALVADPQPPFGSDYVVDSVHGQIAAIDARNVVIDMLVARSAITVAAMEPFGQGCGPLGEPTITRDRPSQPGAASHWQGRTFAPTPTILVLGLQSDNVQVSNGCSLLVGGPLVTMFTMASAAGWMDVPLYIPPANNLIGLQVFAQQLALLPSGSLEWSHGTRETVGQ